MYNVTFSTKLKPQQKQYSTDKYKYTSTIEFLR